MMRHRLQFGSWRSRASTPRTGEATHAVRPAPGRGFTLLEVIVVLAILAALVGGLVPLVFQSLERQRTDATRRQLRSLKDGILGGRATGGGGGAAPAGQDRAGTFGFAGDVGALPDSLEQLFRRDALPAFQMDPDWRLGAGWRGPYVAAGDAGVASALRDAFGRRIDYSTADVTVGGEAWDGFLRSAGPDGRAEPVTATGTDDIVVPLRSSETAGRASGFLRHGSGQPVSEARVTYAYRDAGQVVTTATTTDEQGAFTGPSHAPGPAVVRTGATTGTGLGFVRGLTRVLGPSDEDLEFHVLNVVRSPVTVTALTATWSGGPTCYSDVRFAGVDVDGGGVNCHTSGSTVSFTTGVGLEGGGGFGNSVSRRRVELDRATFVIPELVVTGAHGRASRGEALVELLDWQDGAGNPVAIPSGLNITVTLTEASGASLTSTFTTP